ncbi:MAG: DNA polymerase II [Candidatus Methanofastidiosa archaeon]|nr:DNA polymerase II [Candidatus Methanofastidiosa archaeon]
MATRHKGCIVHATASVLDGEAHIVIYGRLTSGESFQAIIPYSPYFFIPTAMREQACRLYDATFSPTTWHDFEGRPVTKVTVRVPQDVKKARAAFESGGIPCHEADIPFETRFLIDHDIRGYVEITGTPRPGSGVDLVFVNPRVAAAPPSDIPLKVLSVDIETDDTDFGTFEKPIISIGLVGEGLREVLVRDTSCAGATTCKGERALLTTFVERIRSFDPDIIIGWNIIDFDMTYLLQRYKKTGTPFALGRDGSPVRLASEASFIKASRARIEGRKVLDAMHLLRDYFYRFEDYRLDTAARELLGEGKVALDMPIADLHKRDPGLLAHYNLTDADLVYRLVAQERLIDVSMALSALTGMQLDRVKASIATLDSLYLRMARGRGIVCPSVKGDPRTEVIGGHVEEPLYGLYHNVIVCDFRSLYPSIIATFNIDPLTFGKNGITAPNGATFGTGDSILPEIILGLLEQREQAKQDNRPVVQLAIKITMNSLFGVLGNPGCRFHNAIMANAITAFGRSILKETSARVADRGYRVVYGDTDSLFIVSHAPSREEAVARGKEIEQDVNAFYDTFVADTFKRKNVLKLSFDTVYDQFLLPKQRHDERGAKKRYAGMVEGELRIVGLEYVRRDWTTLAKTYQYGLLRKVFAGEDYAGYTRSYVASLLRGERDADLVYRKRLRKGLDDYTKTTPPHVKAARMASFGDKDHASLVEYVMTKRGPLPASRAVRIDYRHYVDKQIRPLADSVLTLLGTSFEEVVSPHRQDTLTRFFPGGSPPPASTTKKTNGKV